MGYQNFYATRLAVDIGTSDTVLTLENVPTQTSGRLVLEARNPTQREIIHYTGVAGSTITGVTRGQGGTTAKTHIKNSLVEMNLVAQDLIDALAVVTDITTRFDEVINDHVSSGLVWTDDTGLTADMSAGVAYINGLRLPVSAVVNRAFTASKDTFVDLGDNGVLDYNEVANNATPPAIAANHLRLAKVVTNATDTTSITLFRNSSALSVGDDWKSGHPKPTSVTHNGNGSYTLAYATSIAGFKSPGMRNRYISNVGNTFMGGLFNGTSHYFTKVTPTGTLASTVNNFTGMCNYHLTTVPVTGYIMGRADAAGNNGWGMFTIATTGQFGVTIWNAGAGNFRQRMTIPGISLRKSDHLAFTMASGVINLYKNGVLMPMVAATSGGTAPTSCGLGGDFSIGRNGAAATYAPGYVSNVGFFDAVLSDATIRQYATQPLVGTETNCIGAWSLNNTAVNQVAPGTNDLTATGGVGYTAMSPHNMDANNVPVAGVSYSITQTVSADGLTEVVQVPEGNTIGATVANITDVSYSTARSPYGFPSAKERFMNELIIRLNRVTAIGAINQWAYSGIAISVPIGTMCVGANGVYQAQSSVAGVRNLTVALYSANYAPVTNGNYNSHMTSQTFVNGGHTDQIGVFSREREYRITAAEDFSMVGQIPNATGSETWWILGNSGDFRMYSYPANL